MPRLSLTPLPVFKERTVISISPRFTQMPAFRMPRSYRPVVTGSSWDRGLITIHLKFHKNFSYIPLTVNAWEFFKWRAEQDYQYQLRTGFAKQLRDKNARGRGGLRVTIPIKSRAVEALFGEGGAGLQVSGSRRISFAGTSNWVDGVNSGRSNQSRFPTLRMDQSFQFDIVGTIGSKIFVKVNQDSRVNIPLANRLEIRFKGSEDDIIKTIEAGNTTLGLPGASLLRYSSRVRGLFGIKSEAQIGPFRWVGIASQEKANTERASVVSGATPRSDTLRDFRFLRYKKFDLGIDAHFENRDDEIIAFQLYEEVSASQNEPTKARMYVDPRPDPNNPGSVLDDSLSTGDGEGIPVKEVPQEDYFIDSRERTLIFERSTARSSSYLGLWLLMRRAGDTSTYEIGNVTDDPNSLVLKMIKPKTDKPGTVVGNYEWLNLYRIPRTISFDFDNPDFDALEIKVYKGNVGEESAASNLSHQDGVDYIKIIGMDQFSSTGVGADGRADLNTQLLDLQREILILPSRRPFDSDTTFGADPTPVLKVKAPDIYTTTRTPQERDNDSKYYFVYTSRVRSNSISLSGANIVDGSEVVTIGTIQLVRGQDYNIIGNSIQLLSERATDPAANITVDYEVAPLFTVEKKTLLGTRLEYRRSRDFNIGTTLLFKSDKATTRKPKVGQETSKMFAGDINFAAKLRPNFLTGIVDAIPGVRAKGPSNISIQGEIAQSHPNPNVDGQAFIDDFEGSRQEISISLRRSRWNLAAKPVDGQVDPITTNRGRIYWYVPQNGVLTQEIFAQETSTAGLFTRPLNIVFEPSAIKIDTQIITSLAIDSVSNPIPDTTFDLISYYQATAAEKADTTKYKIRASSSAMLENWSGITQRLSEGAWNQSNAEHLEIRLRVRKKVRSGLGSGFLHFDMGVLSEDVIPNGKIDQEGGIVNTIYDLEGTEDVGLDGRTDAQEAIWYKDVIGILDPSDPAGDNYPYAGQNLTNGVPTPAPLDTAGFLFPPSPDGDRLKKINGHDKNFDDQELRLVDSEDLGNDSQTNLVNDYFSFKVALDVTATENNFFVEGSETPAGWRTIRIPLQEPRAQDTIVGIPSWTEIQYLRIWIDSVSDTMMLEIASMELVSSNWRDTLHVADSIGVSRSEFELAVINTAEDSSLYNPPAGVTGSLDQINNIREPEQSLRLDFTNLIAGDTGIITKLQSAANYTGYRELRMFVHGDERAKSVPDSTTDLIEFFFRIGTDAGNFYEFRTTLDSGWAAGNEVVMDFNDLTALKDKAINSGLVDDNGILDSKKSDPRYRVRGRPTLRAVRYIAAGLTNGDTLDTDSGVTGSVWLDELRLSEVRRDVGTAGQMSISGNLGDFITNYSARVSFQDAFYRGIAQSARGGSANSLGSGRSDLRYQFGLSFQADKILPPNLGARIPIRLSFSRNTSTPLLVTAGNSDIVLPPERRREERTIQTSRGFSIRESFNKKTKNPLFTILLNKIKTNFDYTRTESSSPTVPKSIGENYSAGMSYNPGGIPQLPKIPLLFMFSKAPFLKRLAETKLSLSPNSFSITSNFRRNLSLTVQDLEGRITSRHTRTLKTNMNSSFRWLTNLSSRLTVGIQSDLRDPDWVNISTKNFRLGKVTRLQQSLGTDYSPTLFSFLTHRFTFSSSYSENLRQNVVDLEANPQDSALEPLQISQTLRMTVTGSFDLQKFLGGKGRGRSGVAQRARDARKRNLERARQLRRQQAGVDDTLAADTAAVEKKDDGPAGPWIGSRIYDGTRNTLKRLTRFIDPVTGSFEKGQVIGRNGLRGRPGPKFRFGFSDEIGVDTVLLRNGQINTFSQSSSWKANSGFKLFGGGITTRVDLSESRSTSYPTTGSAGRSIDRTWPRTTIQIRQIKTFSKIWGLRTVQNLYNSAVRKFGPQTAYNRRTSERMDLTTGFVTSKTSNVDQSPVLGLTIPLKRQLNLTVRYEKSKREVQRFQSRSGKLSSASIEENTTIRLKTAYSFRSPNGIKLPIFGRIKIQSNVTINIDVLKRRTESRTSGNDGIFRIASKRETFTVTTNASYSFSSQVSGGMSTIWTDTNDVNSGRKTHTREMRLFAQMRF